MFIMSAVVLQSSMFLYSDYKLSMLDCMGFSSLFALLLSPTAFFSIVFYLEAVYNIIYHPFTHHSRHLGRFLDFQRPRHLESFFHHALWFSYLIPCL